MLPPIVARFRVTGEPTIEAPSISAAALAGSAASSSASGVAAPTRTVSAEASTPRSARRRA
jgi:hypothetical protein